MADAADQSQDNIDLELSARIQAARTVRTLPSIGKCHNCEEPLENPRGLYCDAECAQEHDYITRRQRQNQ